MKNNVEDVRRLLETCVTKEEINWQDKYGFTALHSAVAKTDINVKILKYLLEFDGIQVNIPNNDHNTPLHYFCQKFKWPEDCQEILEMLIKKGADLNVRNKVQEAPIHKAIFNNAIRLLVVSFFIPFFPQSISLFPFKVDLLISNGADVNAKNLDDETPLHYAVRLNRKDLVQTLVVGGADLSCKGKRENKTAYEMAVKYGYNEMAQLLKKIQGKNNDFLSRLV
jgi:ankyrin repeat protein